MPNWIILNPTCQTAQASVTQACVLFNVLQLLHIQTQLDRMGIDLEKFLGALFPTSFYCISHLVGGLIAGALQGQIHHGVLQGSAHVELQREVVHTLWTAETDIQWKWSGYMIRLHLSCWCQQMWYFNSVQILFWNEILGFYQKLVSFNFNNAIWVTADNCTSGI